MDVLTADFAIGVIVPICVGHRPIDTTHDAGRGRPVLVPLAREGRVSGNQACGAGALRRAAPGSEALRHSNDGDLTGDGRHGAAEQRNRSGRRRENSQVLCGGGGSCRVVREGSYLRHQPAGGRGRERNFVQADQTGTLSRQQIIWSLPEAGHAPRY